MGWTGQNSWTYASKLSNTPTLATYYNDTGKKIKITSFWAYLGTGKGAFNAGSEVTGDGSAISFYVSINGQQSSKVNVTAVCGERINSSGQTSVDRSNCTLTTVYFSPGVEVDAGATVSVLGDYNSTMIHNKNVLIMDRYDHNPYVGGAVEEATVYYTVSYNANGGTGAPDPQTKTGGVNLTLSSTKPTRANYAFSHWNTAANNTGTSYQSGGTYSTDADMTLYAQWTELTYTVTYHANGGEGAPSVQTKYATKVLTLSSTKPTKTGHTFSHWNTKADGSGTTYASGGTYSTNADVTLYAIYNINTWPVTYNANGGTGAPSTQTKTYGIDLALSSTKPTLKGHTFVEWNTAVNGTGTSYQPGGIYTSDASLVLYAIWRVNSYTISFDGNGVDLTQDEDGRFDPETYNYGASFIISDYVPENSGYAFQYWCKDKNGTGSKYYPGATYTLTDDYNVTLYAIWSLGTYTVTFDLKGGTRTGGGATVQTVQSGGAVIPPTVVKNGKSFQGWLGDYTNVTSNRTIVALWDSAPLWIYRNGKWEQLK